MFITADRTSNWELHLDTLAKMLNLFAATGHIKYAKCSRLYLQNMQELQDTNPVLYRNFMDGEHTVRLTGTSCSGVPTDYAIEVTLNRDTKTPGGLIHRSFKESTRLLWTTALSNCAQIYKAITQFAGTHGEGNDSHIELSISRQKLDFSHCRKFYEWLKERNPFKVQSINLHSLSTGLVSITGHDNVSCERAQVIGLKIQQSFDNKCITKCSTKRSELAVPMSSLYNVQKDKDMTVPVDNQTMFVRLIAVAERLTTLKSAFDYELTSEPMALFKHGLTWPIPLC